MANINGYNDWWNIIIIDIFSTRLEMRSEKTLDGLDTRIAVKDALQVVDTIVGSIGKESQAAMENGIMMKVWELKVGDWK